MIELYWNRLDHCPEKQLIKSNDTDAGYDIASAEDKLIVPYNLIPFSWEEVGLFSELNIELQTQLNTTPGLFFSGDLRKEGEKVFRKKYKFPLIKTGIQIASDKLLWTGIYLRSSSSKYGFGLANNVGVVDYSYIDNELYVALFSRNGYSLVKRGERIAQLVPHTLYKSNLHELPNEEYNFFIEGRDSRGGFGSTGI